MIPELEAAFIRRRWGSAQFLASINTLTPP
jgi:hypothetical protein